MISRILCGRARLEAETRGLETRVVRRPDGPGNISGATSPQVAAGRAIAASAANRLSRSYLCSAKPAGRS